VEEGDEAEHQRHAAPLIRGQAFAQGNARDFTDDVVHGAPWLDANDLQVAKATRETSAWRTEITATFLALRLECRNLRVKVEVFK